MDQLRATFIAGPETGMTAQEAFTNRLNEVEAFRLGVDEILKVQTPTGNQPSLDITAPRRNVMVYYGIGGIGKTALSRQLERQLRDRSFDGFLPERAIAVRRDFGESGALSLEEILLELRAEFGRLRKSWPAFDLTFRMYWERVHPGESFPEFVRRGTVINRGLHRLEVAEQMQEILGQVLQELGMAWSPSRIALRVVSLTKERLAQSRTFRRLSEECPFFEPIITADSPSDALSYMPSLLAWELDRIPRPYLAVVFLDTFEAITARSSREMERLLQRMIYLMPTVLFIITSRNHLDWAVLQATGELDYTGPTRWPQLDLDNGDREPRQHLVGSLSTNDCDNFLRSVLRQPDGTPVLESDLRERITSGSEGLPLYLDLAVTQYLELVAIGREPRPEEFGGPLPSVVQRVMRNLDEVERNILRGVSLLDAFDADLAQAASAGSDSKIGRFIGSALVIHTSDPAWPYALHTQLRHTIQEVDGDLGDAWSDREWRDATRRIFARLGDISETARARRDRTRVAACMTQAVRLSSRIEAVPGWVLDAAQFLADSGSWQALDVRLPSRQTAAVTAALVEGMRGIRLRRDGSLERSVAAFDAALASPELEGQAKDLLKLHRAHSLRNAGHYDRARDEYAQLGADSSVYAARARLQIADIHLLRGEFPTALEVLGGLPEDDPDVLGECLRIRGHVHRANALFDTAELMYRRALDLGRAVHSPALEGKAMTNIAETLCWTNITEGHRISQEAIDFNSGLGNQLEVLKAHVAQAVASDAEESEAHIVEALRLAEYCQYRAGVVFALSARLFHGMLRADRESAGAIAPVIREITSEINAYQYWKVIAGWWTANNWVGDAPSEPRPRVAPIWLNGPGETRERWVAVLENRRATQ